MNLQINKTDISVSGRLSPGEVINSLSNVDVILPEKTVVEAYGEYIENGREDELFDAFSRESADMVFEEKPDLKAVTIFEGDLRHDIKDNMLPVIWIENLPDEIKSRIPGLAERYGRMRKAMDHLTSIQRKASGEKAALSIIGNALDTGGVLLEDIGVVIKSLRPVLSDRKIRDSFKAEDVEFTETVVVGCTQLEEVLRTFFAGMEARRDLAEGKFIILGPDKRHDILGRLSSLLQNIRFLNSDMIEAGPYDFHEEALMLEDLIATFESAEKVVSGAVEDALIAAMSLENFLEKTRETILATGDSVEMKRAGVLEGLEGSDSNFANGLLDTVKRISGAVKQEFEVFGKEIGAYRQVLEKAAFESGGAETIDISTESARNSIKEGFASLIDSVDFLKSEHPGHFDKLIMLNEDLKKQMTFVLLLPEKLRSGLAEAVLANITHKSESMVGILESMEACCSEIIEKKDRFKGNYRKEPEVTLEASVGRIEDDISALKGHIDGLAADSYELLRKLAESSVLARTEESYLEDISGSFTGIGMFSRSGDLVYGNRSLKDILGMRDIYGMRSFNVFRDRNFSKEEIKALGEGVPLVFRVYNPSQAGYDTVKTEEIEVDACIVPLAMVEGRPSGFILQVQDVARLESLDAGDPVPGEDLNIKEMVESGRLRVLPFRKKALELQMLSAERVALVYGDMEKGVRELRRTGFKGEIRHAAGRDELEAMSKSGELAEVDIIVNTTGDDIRKILANMDLK
ncbi:MAG: hypothetical protein GF392_01845, partial [Candidatus Omnitrophica bacterium]|nr:hypothetical protein [Candidatus Omnitrophota bacterium]